jgi:hypothetical protein
VIASRLDVALSSVSLWTRDIRLTDEQHARLRDANPIYNRQLRGQGGRRASARAARLSAQERGRALARRRDPNHLLGCMLYWAEGSKSRNSVIFCNSDPEMLRAFLAFLRGPAPSATNGFCSRSTATSTTVCRSRRSKHGGWRLSDCPGNASAVPP